MRRCDRPSRILRRARRAPGFALSAAFLFATTLLAAPRDGRWAIDAACVPVGCFGGDAPGFPVEITVPGSYVLSSDLDVRSESSPEHTVAIHVTAPAVDLDLDGFALRGPVECSDHPVLCSPTGGLGVGVLADAGAVALRIHDGTIRGFGAHGVQLFGDLPGIERMRFTHQRSSAVVLFGLGARVSEVVLHRNGGLGLFVGGPGGSIRDVSTSVHGNGGIQAGPAATVESSLVSMVPYGSNALVVGAGSRVGGNLISGGSTGIVALGGSLVAANISTSSLDWQLVPGAGSGYTANWLINSSNQYTSGGQSMGQNLCETSNC